MRQIRLADGESLWRRNDPDGDSEDGVVHGPCVVHLSASAPLAPWLERDEPLDDAVRWLAEYLDVYEPCGMAVRCEFRDRLSVILAAIADLGGEK